ncbi:MAG: hypothetical protein ACHRHE_15845, partial [Tepidisphaerales bacterium]
MNEPTSRFLLRPAFAAAFGLLALAGCQSARVAKPLPPEMLGNAPDQQMAYWHTLAERTLTSNDEAFHGLLLYADARDECKSYDERVALLKSRRMLPPGFNAPADQAITRGTLAVAVCRIIDLRGGLMYSLLPANPRYAVRELEFMELYPPSSPQQTFSGPEFLGIVGRIEDYQRGNPAN